MKYTTEKHKFLREWKKLNEAYKAEGADDETIKAVYEAELEAFRERMKDIRHTVYVDFDEIPTDEIPTSVEPFDETRCESLLDTIENPYLLGALRRLSGDDLSLLCDVVVDGCTQKEAAKIRHLSPTTINYRYKRILRRCKEYMEKHMGKSA